MQDVYGVAAFRSRSQVFAFEGILRREGVASRIVSTPRDVSMGCGLSGEVRGGGGGGGGGGLEDTAAVIRSLRRMNTGNLIGLYRVDATGGGRPRLSAIPMR